MGPAALPGLAEEVSPGTGERPVGSSGAERAGAACLGGGVVDQAPVELPVRGLASAVRPAGNAASAADHQSLLSHARGGGPRDGGVSAGAQPSDVSPAAVPGGRLGGTDGADGRTGVPAEKFNDDRLERTLDTLAPHLEAIWTEVVTVALRKAAVDLSVIFYDLTAFVVHGRYANSELVDFGFAHNTPNDKRKFKLALNTIADGNLPGLYRPWSGRTADQATVQNNMQNLQRWLAGFQQPQSRTLVVGDRAMLNAEIALTYERTDLQYLSGLKAHQKEHRALLQVWSDAQFEACPIVSGPQPQYWGRGCQVTFTHEGQTVTQRGLVVLAGPLRDQLRQARQRQLQELQEQLAQVRADIGTPRLRSHKAVQRRVHSRLRTSPVGHLMDTQVYTNPQGQLHLTWQVNPSLLAQEERRDGRYLLVTNNWRLSHAELFQLYRDKDGGEKRFLISKSDLRVSPVFLHKDERIAAMLLLNMIALLAYSLLERQLRQQGLQLTTRQLIRRLQDLTLIETRFIDGSCMRRLTSLAPECLAILPLVLAALESLIEQATPTQQPAAALSGAPPPLLLPKLS